MGPQYGPLCGPHPSLACDQKSTVPPHQPPPGVSCTPGFPGHWHPHFPCLSSSLGLSPVIPLHTLRPPTTVGTLPPAVCLPTGYDAPALWRLLPARPGTVNQLWLGQPSRSVHCPVGCSHTISSEVWSTACRERSVSSVTQSCPTLCNLVDCSMPGFSVHHQLKGLLNSCPSSWWCHPTISSSVIPFSSCHQSFPASGSFPVSQFFLSDGQSIGSFSFSISPSNEYSGLISFRMDWLDLLAVQVTLKSLL